MFFVHMIGYIIVFDLRTVISVILLIKIIVIEHHVVAEHPGVYSGHTVIVVRLTLGNRLSLVLRPARDSFILLPLRKSTRYSRRFTLTREKSTTGTWLARRTVGRWFLARSLVSARYAWHSHHRRHRTHVGVGMFDTRCSDHGRRNMGIQM